MLTTPSPPELVQPILDRRLAAGVTAPLAVALSGGGDSMALLHIAADWAKRAGRRLIALHVDHQINPASAAWAKTAEAAALRLGAEFRRLDWTGAKPATGLSAAARAARHALLADAAREAGARVILLGHTADDVAEAAVMRAGGSNVGAPREWAPSPAWPQGRGVFLLRPMLAVRRAALREYLTGLGEAWVDDPSNTDPRSARSRARASLGQVDPPVADETTPSHPLQWRDLAGALVISRDDLRLVPDREVAAACLCAAGTVRPPRGEALERLVTRLRSGETFTASLAGARIEADEQQARFMRESGEQRRGGLSPLLLRAGETGVWDGRFQVSADKALRVVALAGRAAKLDARSRAALSHLPAGLRPSLPLVIYQDGGMGCPILADDPAVRLRPLALERFAAFGGYIGVEF